MVNPQQDLLGNLSLLGLEVRLIRTYVEREDWNGVEPLVFRAHRRLNDVRDLLGGMVVIGPSSAANDLGDAVLRMETGLIAFGIDAKYHLAGTTVAEVEETVSTVEWMMNAVPYVDLYPMGQPS